MRPAIGVAVRNGSAFDVTSCHFAGRTGLQLLATALS